MNKKFLSAILFGALMVSSTGTFVSCKDYDDDIDNLQGQIDKLATKEDMEAKLAQMQAAIDAAKATAEEALKKAEAGGNADEIADLTKRIEALEKATIDVEALKKELKDAVNEDIDKFRGEMEELIGEVEGLVGKIADLVTSVELVKSYAIDQESGFAPIMLSTAIEQENVFSEGISNKITFTKDAEVQTPGQFLVRVSPTNAVLTPDMISLVNSQGENLDGILEVVKVEKSEVLLSRAANESGLWNVTVQLKNYGDGKAFDAATSNEGKKILFAAQVNNTLSTSETRYVTSSYDLTLGWKEFEGANKLNYFVDTKNVAEINNRFNNTSLSLKEQTATIDYKELEWKDKAAVKPTADNTINDDNRSAEEVYPAVQGQALKIALSSSNDEVVAPTNIRAIYVVLDKQNAVESAPSELNAWNSYTYTGLNTVVEGTSTEITIDSKSAINDIIGFRVFAVNYDGTLVDPDGKAFYVNLGDKSADWNAVDTKITALSPDAVTATKSEEITVSLTKLTAPTTAEWTTDKIDETTPVFHAYFVDKDNQVIYNTSSANNLSDVDFSKVAKVYTMPALPNWTSYEDNKAYNGTLTIKNESGHVLATMNLSMTKVLPSGIPEGFSIKTAQVAEGIYNCYMIPDTWAASQATEGTMEMSEIFNFGKGTPAQYNISFATSTVDNNNKPAAITVKGDEKLVVNKDYINNNDKHVTTVVYNYGKISSVKEGAEYVDVTRAAAEFQTIYNCIYNNTYSWHWATAEELKVDKLPYSTELTYGTDADLKADTYIYGVSTWDGRYSAFLNDTYESSLVIEDATLTSDANGEEEYFDVEIADDGHIVKFNAVAESSTTNPTAPVQSTLTITAKDMYGHDVVIKLPMTVNKR